MGSPMRNLPRWGACPAPCVKGGDTGVPEVEISLPIRIVTACDIGRVQQSGGGEQEHGQGCGEEAHGGGRSPGPPVTVAASASLLGKSVVLTDDNSDDGAAGARYRRGLGK